MQSASTVQLAGHERPPLHTKGQHEGAPAAPEGDGLHVPTEPGNEQVAQAPTQVVSQHTPPTQCPEVQLTSSMQDAPFALEAVLKISVVPTTLPPPIPPATRTRPSP